MIQGFYDPEGEVSQDMSDYIYHVNIHRITSDDEFT